MSAMMAEQAGYCHRFITHMNPILASPRSTYRMILELLNKAYRIVDDRRVQVHLRVAERVLAEQNVDHLPDALRERRTNIIGYLHEYWMQGKFPKNNLLPYRAPYLRDDSGTPCAVAYIVHRSGSEELIDSLSRIDNNIYIDDVEPGPFYQWLENSGLTKREAAKVQPGYGPTTFEIVGIFASLVSFVVWFTLLHLGSSQVLRLLTFGSGQKKMMARIYFFLTNVTSAALLAFLIFLFFVMFVGYF